MNNDEIFNTHKWERLRLFVLSRDEYLDQVERRFGKNRGAETVHHIFPREYFPEFTFKEWNLISVSKRTHNKLHARGGHKLTPEGWELLRRTARKNNISLPEGLKENIVEDFGRNRPPRSRI